MFKKFWLFILVLNFIFVLKAQVFNGVFVGIEDYADNSLDMDYCAWDAEEMRNTLVNSFYWSVDSTELILDDDATQTYIINAIQNMSQTSIDNDIFYFSGHGNILGLICYNSNNIYYENHLEDQFESTYSSYACYIDACRSGKFPLHMKDKGVICSSCSSYESSYTDSASGHSIYTKYLLQGLQNNIHHAEDLHFYAAPLTYNHDNRMVPRISDNFAGKLLIGYSLKDTLLNDESWYRSLELEGDIVVPDTITLTIKNSVDISLSTHSVTTSIGTITIESNATISPHILLKNGNAIKGLYPTLSSALLAASSGETLEFGDTLTLSSNITLPSGVTLKICNDGELNLGSHTITGDVVIESGSKLTPNICVESMYPDKYFPSTLSAVSYISDPSDKLILNGDYTMTQDLTVEEFNLEIGEKSNIDMNGKKIFIDLANMGWLTNLSSGAKFLPDIRSFVGSNITGFHSSILSAFSSASYVEVKDTLVTTTDQIVPSGKTLKVLSNAVLKMASGKYIDVYGSLNATSASLIPSSTFWGGIRYKSGSSGTLNSCYIGKAVNAVDINNASPTIDDCVLHYNTSYAFKATNNANPTITNNDIWNNANGIYVSGADATISDNTIEDCLNYGLYCYNSDPEISTNSIIDSKVYLNNSDPEMENNHITGSTSSVNPPMCSFYMYNSSPVFLYNTIDIEDVYTMITYNSNPEFGLSTGGGEPDYGYNVLDNDANYDGIIHATTGSTVWLGEGDAGPYAYGGNSIFGGTYPLWADGTSEIYAQFCYWTDGDPAPNCYGDVYTDHELGVDPEGGSSLAKSLILSNDGKLYKSIEDSLFHYAKTLIRKEKDYASALTVLEMIIKDYQDTKYASSALNYALMLCKKHEVKKSEAWLSGISHFIENDDLSALIDLKRVMTLHKNNKTSQAIALSEEIPNKRRGDKYETAALFNLFNFYQKDLGMEKEAELYYNELLSKYPKDELTYLASLDMKEELSAEGSLKKELVNEDPEEVILPTGYSLSAAYPNPFNPTTTFDYDLPLDSKVKCMIYDLSGNVVKSFTRDQTAGQHSIKWKAAYVSSGIYIVRFTATASDGSDSFVDYQKVTLLK